MQVTSPSRLRQRPERGASMVEAAIVTPVVVALLFGIVEFGMLFKDYLGLNAMVRAGTRAASANPRSALLPTVTVAGMQRASMAINPANVEELWIYKANTTNDFPLGLSSFADCTVCMTFRWDYGTGTFVVDKDTWASTDQNACAAGSGGPPDRVGVYMKIKHDPMTGIIRSLKLSENSVTNFEPYPVLSGCK